MPRKEIKLDHSIEHLSILDENGRLDQDLMPDLSKEQLLRFHRGMLLARRFDERLLLLQRQGHIGTFAPVKGQEAAQIGAVANLKAEDWMLPAFREIAAILWRGTLPSALIIFNAGYNEGGKIPQQQRDFPNAVPVASQLPHGVGIAYGIKYRKKQEVVLTFFGDGATSEGDFHEALNFAAVFEVPAVFICQNNHWAISVPREKQTKSKTLAQKALAYGIPGIQVDGNDVLAVYAATQEAVERARSGGGPTLIECVTYRLTMHTTVDDPTKYRQEEEVKIWEKRDPLPRFQKFLQEAGHLSEKDIDDLEKEIKEHLDTEWSEAQQQMEKMGNPLDMFEHVYAQLPPYLQEQKEAFSQFIEAQKEADHA
ncbi:pyruvate dehydrogenase (acetyl-transferring) E1 component, alpha subunit [Nitrosococcus halophilus Nc 4]|uniref:Pyruvate dehydrogenase E1 component subunit alpha n=1 Tax=Nitrosococcus halophilus (strain Nc4) TaxID=472759 RepID=D5C528_NITHN|nr:pyruvate dehydrogenase (acetyl-transferring) E1 component subunit alpha [Nitrosococcus halophilus]ADE15251.1 pyruvate dehydrogenase (acetyl-transferring) E1 component, alpha subunit [Nitrosococcus halophilus Nc 4]